MRAAVVTWTNASANAAVANQAFAAIADENTVVTRSVYASATSARASRSLRPRARATRCRSELARSRGRSRPAGRRLYAPWSLRDGVEPRVAQPARATFDRASRRRRHWASCARSSGDSARLQREVAGSIAGRGPSAANRAPMLHARSARRPAGHADDRARPSRRDVGCGGRESRRPPLRQPPEPGRGALPAHEAGPASVAVVVHGGYWRSRYDRSLMTELRLDLAAHGWAAWNLEYRRVGLEADGRRRSRTSRRGSTPLRSSRNHSTSSVISVGHSAGGHLALWLAGRGGLPAGTPGADLACACGPRCHRRADRSPSRGAAQSVGPADASAAGRSREARRALRARIASRAASARRPAARAPR